MSAAKYLSRLPGRLRFAWDLGPRAAAAHLSNKFLHVFPQIQIRTRHAQHPLWYRPRFSDLDVFRQIFWQREYSCFDHLRDVKLVIDCGANVGYSSAYFLSRFPDSFVIAIEPNLENFQMLSRNLSPYAGRYRVVHAAIWTENAPLRVATTPFRDGRAWSFAVEKAEAEEEPAVMGTTITDLFQASGFDRISILKIDIEGSETALFASSSVADWLPQVDNLCIELHDDNAVAVFDRTMAGQPFAKSVSGELTVCQREGA